MYLPLLLLMGVAAVPFFLGLFQALLLLSYIGKNTAFSDLSVAADRGPR